MRSIGFVIPLKNGIQNLFNLAWRVAILLLPWQTRWFQDASLVGWPWEQGRVSVYVSWIFILLSIVVGFLSVILTEGRTDRNQKMAEWKNPFWKFLFDRGILRLRFAPLRMTVAMGFLFLLSLLATRLDPSSLPAALQWWFQILLLGCFVWTLLKHHVSTEKIATWSVLSLIPQVFLAACQLITQSVMGSSWLGMATQLPSTLGVSVIEFGGERILRLYGSFPHPNILGGWMAVGLIITLWLGMRSSSRRSAILWSAYATCLSAVLFFTFSRSAWLAFFVGFFFVILSNKQKSEESLSGKGFFGRCYSLRMTDKKVILIFPILTFALLSIFYHPLLSTRLTSTQRLEQKSVDQRTQSLRDGITIFFHHSWLGTGPNAELPELARERGLTTPTTSPLESPHNVLLLILVNFGLIGSVFLFMILYSVIRHSSLRHSFFHPLLATFFILAMLDHYLWSYWSGQTLVAFVFLFLTSSFPPQAGASEPA